MSSFNISDSQHAEEVENWKIKRVANLTSENGWLTLCGLFWLKEGRNRVGNENETDVIVPNAGKHIADLVVTNFITTLEVVPGGELFIIEGNNKKLITEPISLKHDDDGKQQATLIQVDSTTVSFFIIKRGDKLAVRVKDSSNEARKSFKGLTYFPLNHSARVLATFHPYSPFKELPIKTVLDMDANEKSPGYLEFKWNETTYKIDTIHESPDDKEFFLILKDKTCGKETYGMRYLVVPIPPSFFGSTNPEDNKTVIDFNKLYNPPCCFTHFATCALPPPQNIYPFRIEAGEKLYDEV